MILCIQRDVKRYPSMSDDRLRINVTISPALKRFLELKGELTGESVAGTAREILSNAMLGELDAVTKAHQLSTKKHDES